MQLIIGTTANFNAFQGFDVFASPNDDSVDKAALPKIHRVLKTMKISGLREMMAKEIDADADLIRPWACVGRQNHTTRPDTPMDWIDLTVEESAQKVNGKLPFRIWLETTTRKEDGTADWVSSDLVLQTKNPTQPILLFLKYFDVDSQTLTGRGYVYIDKSKRVAELGPLVLDRMGWSAGTNIKLYEEIKSDMIEPLKTSNSFQQSELQSGDIICFQKHVPESELSDMTQTGKPTDAKQFYDYLMNRTTITMYAKGEPENKDGVFELELSRKMTYDQVAIRVGEQLNVPPTHLRFSSVLQATGKPRLPMRRVAGMTLYSMTTSQAGIYGQTGGALRPDVLMYEVLEISLAELETKKQIKLNFLTDGITKEEVFDVLVPKTGVVRDFIAPLKKKANISDEDEHRLRFFEVHGCKIYKELSDDHPVSSFNEFITIYAELIPKEEDDAVQDVDRAIYCFHYDKEPLKVHGVPFKFIVKRVSTVAINVLTALIGPQDEIFKDTKERLSKRTGIKGKNFDRIKFFIVRRMTLQKPELLTDGELLVTRSWSHSQLTTAIR